MLLSTPITAECIVAPAKILNREIQYGECFLRYPYEQTITLVNTSEVVHTKFEFQPQPLYTKGFAHYEAEPSIAVIEPVIFMFPLSLSVCLSVCVCVRVCVRACVCACVCLYLCLSFFVFFS